MVPSMFGLDHRLSELRPSPNELRLARQLRDTADPALRAARDRADGGRGRLAVRHLADRASRLAAS